MCFNSRWKGFKKSSCKVSFQNIGSFQWKLKVLCPSRHGILCVFLTCRSICSLDTMDLRWFFLPLHPSNSCLNSLWVFSASRLSRHEHGKCEAPNRESGLQGLPGGNLHFKRGSTIWVFPKIGGKPPKWMVYNGTPY